MNRILIFVAFLGAFTTAHATNTSEYENTEEAAQRSAQALKNHYTLAKLVATGVLGSVQIDDYEINDARNEYNAAFEKQIRVRTPVTELLISRKIQKDSCLITYSRQTFPSSYVNAAKVDRPVTAETLQLAEVHCVENNTQADTLKLIVTF